jgi:hypothetical protein
MVLIPVSSVLRTNLVVNPKPPKHAAKKIRLHHGMAPPAAKKVIVLPFGRSSGLSLGLSISQATIPHLSFCRAASVLFAISFIPQAASCFAKHLPQPLKSSLARRQIHANGT